MEKINNNIDKIILCNLKNNICTIDFFNDEAELVDGDLRNIWNGVAEKVDESVLSIYQVLDFDYLTVLLRYIVKKL